MKDVVIQIKSKNKSKEAVLSIDEKLKAAIVPDDEQPYPVPENWLWTRIGQVSNIISGYGFPKEMQGKTSGDLPFYKVGDISEAWLAGKDYLSTANHYISHKEAAGIKARAFPTGTTVMAKIGEAIKLNRRAILSEPSLVDNNVMGISPDASAVSPKYNFFYLLTVSFTEYTQATTVPSVRKSDVSEIAFPLSPLSEQQRIADKLESLLGKIKEAKALLDEIPEILQNFRQSVLAAACSGRLTEDWRTENPDINAAKKISKVNESRSVLNDTQLFQIPNNWAWKKVGNICTVITGKTPPTADPKYTDSDDLPFITPAAFNMGDRLSYSERYVSNAAVKVAPLIPAQSVLLTSIGATLGKVAFLEVPAVVNQQINALIPRDIEALYIFRWTCSQSFQETMWAKSSATTLPIINKSRCEQLPIPIPPLPEQHEIVRRVESLFSKADDLEAQYKEAMELIETLPEIILSNAFHGELVPQDPNDEPASKLLERIMAERSKRETEKVEGTKRRKHRYCNSDSRKNKQNLPASTVFGNFLICIFL